MRKMWVPENWQQRNVMMITNEQWVPDRQIEEQVIVLTSDELKEIVHRAYKRANPKAMSDTMALDIRDLMHELVEDPCKNK